ncbi:melanoma-associated antigen B4-like [Manis pentadactyla]|uniref:melanoma-associated antigen B4-like n=1 Tax=Manis pentadactyla TaxID=143292 RepID=UPI00255C68BC|nr:melanoma-associated antigen B4-like [Manis pentadactyla]
MPRGQKSKRRAREKRRQNRAEAQALSARATAAEEEETTSSSSPVVQCAPSSSPVAGTSQKPERARATTRAVAGVSHPGSDKEAKGQAVESETSSQASASIESAKEDPVTRRVEMLVQLLLYKYKMKEPIKKVDMMKLVNKRYREHFPEILRRAAEHVELVFGLELKEVKPNSRYYTFVNKLDYLNDGSLSSGWKIHWNGILMPVLSVIFLNGNHASEEQIWQFLSMLDIYDGRKHFIFGEPRKLITDLVQEKYLEYHQIPNSNPPHDEFLWGPRAHAETSKMKVLEFLAKIKGTTPTAFPLHYEEALRDEEERARARAAARASTPARAGAHSEATSSHHSHLQ